jgi:hypothetical protein
LTGSASCAIWVGTMARKQNLTILSPAMARLASAGGPRKNFNGPTFCVIRIPVTGNNETRLQIYLAAKSHSSPFKSFQKDHAT